MEGNGVQEVLLERKKRGEGRGGSPDMLRLLEPRIEKKKKTPSSHTLVPLTLLTTFVPSLASSSFSLVYPNPPQPSTRSTRSTPLNPPSKNPPKDHKKPPKLKSQRIHHPNLKALNLPPPKKETKRTNKTVRTRQEALGHMKKKKKKRKGGRRILDVLKEKKGRR